MRGKVKFFDKAKGWGFITRKDGLDYFVHYSNLNMSGFKTLESGDIVSFEGGMDGNNRICAINVTPILTHGMVVHELSKEGLHIMRIGNDKGVHGWYVVDKSDNPVADKEMDLKELAAYVGFDVEGIED